MRYIQINYQINLGSSCVPVDPVDLSFWVAQHLSMNAVETVKLLKYDCAISRLQWEMKYLANVSNKLSIK
jgi:hypothetical protein